MVHERWTFLQFFCGFSVTRGLWSRHGLRRTIPGVAPALALLLRLASPEATDPGPNAASMQTGTQLQLEWIAAPPCPTIGTVRREIELALLEPLTSEIVVRGHVTREADQVELRVEVRIGGQSWERRVSTPNCDGVAVATAVIVASAVAGASVAPPQHRPPPKEQVESEGHTANRPRVLHGARLSIGPELWTLPAVAAFAEAAYVMERGHFRAEAGAGYVSPRAFSYEEPEGTGIRLQTITGTLSLCGWVGGPRVRAPLCAGMEAGALLSSGFGFAGPTRDAAPWLAPRARIGMEVTLVRHVTFLAAVQLVIPILRHSYTLEGLEPIASVRPAGTRVTVGLLFGDFGTRGGTGTRRAKKK